MYKLLFILKRRPGMSHEEFVDYYQNIHSKFVSKACPDAKRYFRKYLKPLAANSSPYDKAAPPSSEQAYDAVMELWFDSKEQFEASPGMNDPELLRVVMEDERKLFDFGEGVLRFTYEEFESEL